MLRSEIDNSSPPSLANNFIHWFVFIDCDPSSFNFLCFWSGLIAVLRTNSEPQIKVSLLVLKGRYKISQKARYSKDIGTASLGLCLQQKIDHLLNEIVLLVTISIDLVINLDVYIFVVIGIIRYEKITPHTLGR